MIDNKDQIIKEIKKNINIEANYLNDVANSINESFYEAVVLMNSCKGRVVITGVGKSGHVGKKIAASLASLGVPSFFVHSCESLHGDLGMITKDDVVVMISNSGKTAEVLGMIPSIRLIGARMISITNNTESPLGLQSDVALCVKVSSEIDSLNLAPTASTTAVLAVGDAIAATISEMRGFKKEDFAVFHPAGALGQKLIKEYKKSVSA